MAREHMDLTLFTVINDVDELLKEIQFLQSTHKEIDIDSIWAKAWRENYLKFLAELKI